MKSLEEYELFLQEIENLIDAPQHISEQQEEYLRMLYGEAQLLPVDNDKMSPMGAEEAITKAGEYVLKMQEKGFVKLSKQVDAPADLYKNTLRTSQPMQVRKELLEEHAIRLPFEAEPYQKFWLTSRIVTDTLREIRTMTFSEPWHIFDLQQKYIDSVSSVSRIMNHQGLLDVKRNSRSQLQQSMKHFVTEAIRIRKELYTNYISQNKIIFSAMSKELREEFSALKPPAEIRQELAAVTALDENDIRTTESITDRIIRLPASYLWRNIHVEEQTSAQASRLLRQRISATHQILNRASNRPVTAQKVPSSKIAAKPPPSLFKSQQMRAQILVRPRQLLAKKTNENEKPPDPELTGDEIHRYFWKESDPLKYERDGDYMDQLTKLEEYTADIAIDINHYRNSDVGFPFKLESKPSKKNVEVAVIIPDETIEPRSSRSMGDVMDNIAAPRMPFETTPDLAGKSPAMSSRASSRKTTARLPDLTYNASRKDAAAMKFLMSRTAEIFMEQTGSSIHERLETIWEKMGFSVGQKLDMVVRYSKDPEESSKLKDALSMWEHTDEIVDHYENAYRTVRDFIHLESMTTERAANILSNLESELHTAETRLREASDKLLKAFGDELVLRRRKVGDLIEARRLKIFMKKQEYGLVQ